MAEKLVDRNGRKTVLDLSGNKYGKLTVMWSTGYKGNQNYQQRAWLCQCECGKEHEVLGISLKAGDTKSCGCQPHGYRTNPETIIRRCFEQYQRNAIARNFVFELDMETFITITQGKCFYCNKLPTNPFKWSGRGAIYLCNGIDRVDNTKGYTLQNSVPCCKTCNRIKSNMTLDHFKEWVNRVHAHWASKDFSSASASAVVVVE